MVHVYTVNSDFFAIFAIFLFANSIKRHLCDVRNSRLGHDIRISVNGRAILPIREGFNFRKLAYAKFRENKTLAKISEFTVWDATSICI